MNAIRLGLARGRIELRHMFTMPSELVQGFLPTVVFMVVIAFLRSVPLGGSTVPLGAVILTSVLGSSVWSAGLTLMAQTLAADREDGTLLRAKALPNGMPAYLTGKILVASGFALASVAFLLVYALLLFHDLGRAGVGGWLKFVLVTVLGLLATLSIGAVLGALFPNPRVSGVIITIPILMLTGISGILFPITVLPEWVQWIAQVFPVYWLGLGMRSALLPDSALVAEIGHSWRDWQTFAVLGAWALVGLILAPIVLRRMTRRGTGSRLGKAIQRVG
ncbi:MAG TPA: ABC transporter permease [Pseudonocardiaceae bacterium]|jgi:ABC-2 type transport system permease protein|nr:ABC transporter permease [Pseudonocardiaceae bacterium]